MERWGMRMLLRATRRDAVSHRKGAARVASVPACVQVMTGHDLRRHDDNGRPRDVDGRQPRLRLDWRPDKE